LPEGPYIKTWLKDDAYCHFKRQMETPKTIVRMDWFTDSIPYSLKNQTIARAVCEVLNLLYNQIIREDNSATYGCYANYYMTRGEKTEYQTDFSAYCEMQPEKSDSVLTMMKNIFFSMANDIDKSIFESAKESLLKSFDELVKTKNGFWIDAIWNKEDRGVNTYTERRALTEQLQVNEVIDFVKHFLSLSHFTETLMQPE
jgi:zinc protease